MRADLSKVVIDDLYEGKECSMIFEAEIGCLNSNLILWVNAQHFPAAHSVGISNRCSWLLKI